MSSPKLELQGALVALLRADATLLALMGTRLWLVQEVAAETQFPYVVITDGQQLPDKAECIDGSEIFIDFHVWSNSRSDAERENIVAAISDAIDEADIAMNNHRCVVIERDSAIFRKDGDQLRRHAIITFRALTEPA